MTIRFGPFTLDLDTRQLTGEGGEIHLAPKAFDLLAALIVERPKILSKNILQGRLWPDTFVLEANMSNLVAEVRAALGDDPHAPRYIRTAHGVGYACCAKATTERAARQTDRAPTARWLEWGRRRFSLGVGEHVIGRDPQADVRLEGSTVSRRHARIVISHEDTVLEDLGSKNGTFRGTAPVSSPVTLADGDNIRIGSLLLTFHARGPFATTATQLESARQP